jgi:GTP-binding protein EngB required for normal cell division
MLDAVDKIRAQGVTEENIQLPTIVVVGDQSSGKSSVLESLAGITLPRGQGIATRVPLILRLQSCKSKDESIIRMDYGTVKDQVIHGEEKIEAAINAATDVLAGVNKAVRDTPISLHIRKPHAPDLTMVDLPGITRVPVHGQPANIYEQIHAMIMKYISPEESIILNVLSAQVDFPTCESIRMSQQVDKEGKRTLAVVTKVDKAPEGLLEKVTTDAVNIGLGYVCVRNRTQNDDTISVARLREIELFDSHPALKDLDRNMVGIPALARKLTKIQSDVVKGCLPQIHKQMCDALHKRRQQLDNLPKGIVSNYDAIQVFLQVQNQRLGMLTQLVRDGNFDLFPDNLHLHYTARLHEKFMKFAEDLHKAGLKLRDQSQVQEIKKLLSEHQGVGLPDFLPHSVVHHLVRKQVGSIADTCTALVDDAFEYATDVVLQVNTICSQGYPNMEKCYKKLAVEALEETKKTTMEFVERLLAKESTLVFTTNDYYLATIVKMNAALDNAKVTQNYNQFLELESGGDRLGLAELKGADGKHQDAWRMKASVAAYWKVMQKRLADEIPLEIRYALQCAIVDLFHREMMVKGYSDEEGFQSLMREDSHLSYNRARIQHRVDALRECLQLLRGIMG